MRTRGPYLTLTNFTDRFGCYVRGNGTLTADWDDGSTTTLTLSGSSQILSHVWAAGAATRTIKITGDITFISGDETAPLGGAGSFQAYGDLSHLPNLNSLTLYGGNHLGGMAQEWGGLTSITAMGSSNLCGVTQPWPNLSNLTLWGVVSIGGPTQAWPLLGGATFGGYVSISGNLQAWPALTSLLITSNYCTIGGPLGNWPNLWKGVLMGANTVSGSMDYLVGIQYWREAGNCSINHPASWLSYLHVCYIELKDATTANVDNLINSMDTNKGQTKPLADRTIICTNGCGAPTSASATARANLIAAGWTVTTN